MRSYPMPSKSAKLSAHVCASVFGKGSILYVLVKLIIVHFLVCGSSLPTRCASANAPAPTEETILAIFLPVGLAPFGRHGPCCEHW